MRILISAIFISFVLLNTFYVLAEEIAVNKKQVYTDEQIAQQENQAINDQLEEELINANAEMEKLRFEAEQEFLSDLKQANDDLERSNEELNNEIYPVVIEEEELPEEQ